MSYEKAGGLRFVRLFPIGPFCLSLRRSSLEDFETFVTYRRFGRMHLFRIGRVGLSFYPDRYNNKKRRPAQ